MASLSRFLLALLVGLFLAGCEETKTVYVEDPSLAPAVSGTTGGGTSGGGTSGGGSSGGSGTTTPSGPKVKVSGWYPTWAGAPGVASLNAAGSAMDEVNPTWYTVLPDGQLGRANAARDTAWVRDMQSRGYEVLPMVDDFGTGQPSRAVVQDPTLRATHIAALLYEVDTYGYDGVDIDYENLASTNRAAFTAFMTTLGDELHRRGKKLTVAVWSKTSEPGTGVRASQDWPALGQVVDRLKIMTYGYGWSGGPAVPISPTWRAEDILRFAVSVVPAQKVYYGIPFFGYRWPAAGGTGKSVTWDSAQALMRQHGVTATYDATQGESTFSYTDSTGVTWVCWFQTDEAVRERMRLSKEIGIGGISIWRLGGDPASFWDVIRSER